MKRFFSPGSFLAIMLLLAAPAQANSNVNASVATAIDAQPKSPVTIENCTAIANDFVNNQVSPPAYAYTQVTVMLSFRNDGKQTATAVKFGFRFKDSFDTLISTNYAPLHGSYAPGVLIEPHRAGILGALQDDAAAWAISLTNQDIGRVECFVSSVRFEDGTVWASK
jgi:hypothetical protein